MPRLNPRLPPSRSAASSRARSPGTGRRQLLRPLATSRQRQIEVLELAPHQRQGDAEALLDHLVP